MDKNTLSNYGWIVIAVLVLSVMIALATPFGTYIEQGVRATTEGLFSTSQNAMNTAFGDLGVQIDDQTFEEGYTGGQSTPAIDMSTIDATLENNDWATIQKVVKAGKTTEAGWKVGDTKTLTISEYKWDSATSSYKLTPTTKTATIIGLNHDGANTATFMIVSSGGIGYQYMNPYDEELGYGTNEGGWEASAMREWLRTDIYNSMTDVKDYIKPVTKLTNNIGYNGNTVSETSDTVFLLSPKECGIEWQMTDDNYWAWPDYVGIDALNAEGTTYEWFNNNTIDVNFWLRSPSSYHDDDFFSYHYGDLNYDYAYIGITVCPAFVIG